MATISFTKHGMWLAQVRSKGKGVSKVFASKSDAEKWATGLEFAVKQGAFKLEASTRCPTLSKCLDRYYKDVSLKKRSAYVEKYLIERLKREPFASEPLNRITPDMLAKCRDRRLKVVGAQNVRHELGLLRHMFKIARKEWLLKFTNPMEDFEFPKQPGPRTRYLTPAEKTKFETCLTHFWQGGSEFILYVKWQRETTMRRSESLGLKWTDIDLTKRRAFLLMTKNGKSRKVPFSTTALGYLLQLKAHNAIGPFEHLNKAIVGRKWRKLCKIAGLDNFHLHDLRREGITRLRNSGKLIDAQVMDISGHSSQAQMEEYYVKDSSNVDAILATM